MARTRTKPALKKNELPPTPQRALSTTPPASPSSPPQKLIRYGHLVGVGSHIYREQTKTLCNSEQLQDTAKAYVEDFLGRMKPLDPLEELLVVQALWAHARAGRFSLVACQQTEVKQIQAANAAADGASNLFRKQMLTLAEYRRGPRRDTFMAIKQANVANQQVVLQNDETEQISKNGTPNEQECARRASACAPGLPPHRRGPGIAQGDGSERKALDAFDGPQDSNGQGSLQDERHAPRFTIGNGHDDEA